MFISEVHETKIMQLSHVNEGMFDLFYCLTFSRDNSFIFWNWNKNALLCRELENAMLKNISSRIHISWGHGSVAEANSSEHAQFYPTKLFKIVKKNRTTQLSK